jgi:hypothetical protein
MPYFPTGMDPTGATSVLVVGYSRGDSSLGSILVSSARFGLGPLPRAVAYLQDGMATWTFDKAAVPFRWDDDLGTYRFAWTLADTRYVESGGGTFSLTGKPRYPFPNVGAFTGITETGNAAAMKRILVRAREWARWALADAEARGLSHAEAFVTNWGFYKKLRDDEVASALPAGSTFQVISNQSDVQWNAERAINAYRNFATPTVSNVPYIDPGVPVLFHCFSNGSAVAPCYKLSVLGYKARTVLYGITGAVANDAAGAAAGYNSFWQNLTDASIGGNDFTVSKLSSDPQTLAWAQPAGAGCRACHTDYGKQYELTVLKPSGGATEVLSEGEG